MDLPADSTFNESVGFDYTSPVTTQSPALCPDGRIHFLTRYNGSELLFYARFMPPVNEMVEKISFPLWASLGIPGSILSIYIWSKKNMRKQGSVAAAIYQAALGWVDLCFFLLQILWYLHSSWKLGVLDYSVLCEGFAILNYSVQYASPMLTLIFTVERYIAICFPFRAGARNFGNSCKGAVRVALATIFFCILLASVQGVFYTMLDGNCSIREDFEKEDEPEGVFYTGWTMVTELLMFGLVPFLCLILNIFVIRALHKLSLEDSSASKRDRLLPHIPTANSCTRFSTASSIILPQVDTSFEEHQIKKSSTITLLCVSFYQIIAHFSVALMVVLYNTLPNGDPCLNDEEIAKDLTWRRRFRFLTVRYLIECLGISHYAAKFYIYLATSAAFRQQCAQLFCCNEKNSMPVDSNSFQDSATANFTNGGSNLISPPGNSLAGSSNHRVGASTVSLFLPSRRISSATGGRGSRNDALNRRTPRTRPPGGLSRTVLSESGERVQLKLS